MVQKVEGLYDVSDMVDTIIDNLLTDVFRTIDERSDIDHLIKPKVESLKSDEVKSIGELNEEILGKPQVPDTNKEVNARSCWILRDDDWIPCDDYQSFPNLSGIGVKDSSLSNSSKQGEGDRATMKESPASTRLNVETDFSFDQSPRRRSNSSLNSDTSHNELLKHLQNELNNFSFDSILLTDNDTDEGEEIHSKSFPHNNFKHASMVSEKNDENCESETIVDDQSLTDQIELNHENVLAQSQKFCMYNNVQHFPYNILPQNYCELVDDSYKQYEALDDEEGQRLLSDSSEELVTIEWEKDIPSLEYVVPSSFFVTPSSVNISTQSPRPSTSREMTCPAEVVTNSHILNWEENNEVQVNVIDPSEEPEEEPEEDVEDYDIIKTRQYWSNVGLIQEKTVDRKYLGPTDGISGIENIPGVQHVEKCYLRKSSDELLWMSKSRSLEKSSSQDIRPQSALESNQLNFLTLRANEEKLYSKKKRSLLARLTRPFTNLFRSKKKTAKSNSQK